MCEQLHNKGKTPFCHLRKCCRVEGGRQGRGNRQGGQREADNMQRRIKREVLSDRDKKNGGRKHCASSTYACGTIPEQLCCIFKTKHVSSTHRRSGSFEQLEMMQPACKQSLSSGARLLMIKSRPVYHTNTCVREHGQAFTHDLFSFTQLWCVNPQQLSPAAHIHTR